MENQLTALERRIDDLLASVDQQDQEPPAEGTLDGDSKVEK